MPDTIRDGTGKGYLARINSDNQLITRATAVPQHLKAATDGNYYEVTTGKVTLTDALETWLIYVKNDNANNMVMVIDRMFYDTWTSTGGSGADGTMEYYKNPTITGGTDVVPNSTNFTNQEAAVGTFKKSLTTMTGTEWWTGYLTDKVSFALEEGRFCLPPGASFGISVAAPTGNTNMDISINLGFYYLDVELL